MAIDGTAIRCDAQCCAYHKKLGEVHMDVKGGTVLVVSRHHGTNHAGKVLLIDLVASIVGTRSTRAIQDWIEQNSEGITGDNRV